jgi:hypothetical protein
MEDLWAAFYQRDKDVEILHKQQRRVASMHMGGIAVECLLKAIICDDLPDDGKGKSEPDAHLQTALTEPITIPYSTELALATDFPIPSLIPHYTKLADLIDEEIERSKEPTYIYRVDSLLLPDEEGQKNINPLHQT